MEKSYQNAPENIRTFERDSLDLEAKNDPNSEVHFQVQIDTLTKENKSLSRQLDEARSQHNDTVNSLLDKKYETRYISYWPFCVVIKKNTLVMFFNQLMNRILVKPGAFLGW